MQKRQAAVAAFFGICFLFIVVSRGFVVDGEASGGIAPGYHATTEGQWAISLPPATDYPLIAHYANTPRVQPEPTPAVEAPEPPRAPHRAVTPGVPEGYVYWKTVRAMVTAYDPSYVSCGKYADGRTSIGRNAWVMNGVATDPTAIPYGSYVVIPGVGARIVDDTGSAMRNSWRRHRRYHIDLRVTYPYQARRWGVKYLDVRLYRKSR